MANEKAVPTEREVVLAKAVVDLSHAARNLIASRDDIADALRALVDTTVEANEATLSALLEGQEALADDYPELFTFGERPVAEGDEDEDEDEDECALRVGDWVKVRKPADRPLGSYRGPCWVPEMDTYDGAILQIQSLSEYVTDRVTLVGAERACGSGSLSWKFDVAWLAKLPELPEGFRYLQPDELVAKGDECASRFWNAKGDVDGPWDWDRSGNYSSRSKLQAPSLIYRRRVEAPVDAVDLAAEAAWEPKVGDWVTITRPANTLECPTWGTHMDRYQGKPHKLLRQTESGNWQVDGPYYFNPKWLSPWEPKAGDWVKVTKPEITRAKGKPSWVRSMDRYDGKVLPVHSTGENGLVTLFGLGWDFHSSWLSPAEAPVGVKATGFAALPLDLTQDLMDASVAPEASDEDADEWRVPHPGDVGSIIQVRDADSGWRWTDRKLLAIIPEDLDKPNRGSFVCATKDGDETTICFTWKFARIAKQKPAVEPPAEAPEVPVGVTGFAGLPLDLTQDRRVASGAPEASDEDADEWRVPDVDDIGKLVEVRDSETGRWRTRRLMAVLGVYDGKGQFVCKGDAGCYLWKHARISNKQQPEAPKEEPKPLPHFDKIGKKVVVSRYVAGVVEWHRLGYLVSVSTRPELEGVIEYGVNRFPFDDGLGTDLYYTKNESDSEYRIRLAN
jgi:hypothetical protein